MKRVYVNIAKRENRKEKGEHEQVQENTAFYCQSTSADLFIDRMDDYERVGYILMWIGKYLNIEWMMAVSGAYIAFVWLPL